MAKYTDEQIKKALECCVKSTHFRECFENKCPMVNEYGCAVGKETLYPYALDLINRQEAEKADLQDEIKCEKETNKHLNDEYIALLKKCNCQEAEIERLQTEADRYKRYYFNHEYDKLIETVKSEVIKEFAERLKGIVECDIALTGEETKYLLVRIDEEVKEMVGEGE